MRILWHLVYYFLSVPFFLFVLLSIGFMLFLEKTNRKLLDKFPNVCYNCSDKFDNQFKTLIKRITK